MGKARIKPHIDTGYRRLIEIKDHDKALVVCVACWRKRRDAYLKTYNTTSFYKGVSWNHAPFQIGFRADVNPYEKVVCVDCGARNNNDKYRNDFFHNIWR